LVSDPVVIDGFTSLVAPKLSGSLFGEDKGVNGDRVEYDSKTFDYCSQSLTVLKLET